MAKIRNPFDGPDTSGTSSTSNPFAASQAAQGGAPGSPTEAEQQPTANPFAAPEEEAATAEAQTVGRVADPLAATPNPFESPTPVPQQTPVVETPPGQPARVTDVTDAVPPVGGPCNPFEQASASQSGTAHAAASQATDHAEIINPFAGPPPPADAGGGERRPKADRHEKRLRQLRRVQENRRLTQGELFEVYTCARALGNQDLADRAQRAIAHLQRQAAAGGASEAATSAQQSSRYTRDPGGGAAQPQTHQAAPRQRPPARSHQGSPIGFIAVVVVVGLLGWGALAVRRSIAQQQAETLHEEQVRLAAPTPVADMRQVFWHPRDYEGKHVSISGVVGSPSGVGKKSIFQLWQRQYNCFIVVVSEKPPPGQSESLSIEGWIRHIATVGGNQGIVLCEFQYEPPPDVAGLINSYTATGP